VGLLIAMSTTIGSGVLAQERSFFGVYRVEDRGGGTVELASGTTVHGSQRRTGGNALPVATAYYHPSGPIGQVMEAVPSRKRVGVVGLGVGALAAYGRAADTYTFFEIDPLVVDIARDTRFFTYLADTRADLDIVIGDGRLALLDSSQSFDVLVIDAFNSDAIPIHLLTREAVETYVDRLKPDGVLAVHISNRHFELAPVIGRVASELGLHGFQQFHRPGEPEQEAGSLGSHWVVLATHPAALSWADARWEELPPGGPLWTDDYSDILRVLRL
jgi:SAM-dependent methyltransferase